MNKVILLSALKNLAKEIIYVYLTLMKIMIPVVLVVKALELLGAIQWLAALLSPVMVLVGLPDTMGIVWATTMATNIYAGMVVFYEVAANETLTVAQISILGVMMLLAHGLPVEVAIAKKAGVRVRATLLLRIGGALLLGVILNYCYQTFGLLQRPSEAIWQPSIADSSLSLWLLEQLKTYVMIFIIIAVLITLLKILRLIGVERLMHWLMSPLLKLLGISKSASNTTIIGITLGLSFGGALLIDEARSGRLSQRDVFISLGFLALCHSLIEDTLLVMMLGADIYTVLWIRLIFSLVVLTVIARCIYTSDTSKFKKYLMNNR